MVVEESLVAIPPAALLSLLGEPARWPGWWPGSRATLVRSGDGLEWTLVGTLVGTSSVTVTADAAGAQVSYRLEADPAQPGSPGTPRRLPDSPHGRREVDTLIQRHRVAWKRAVFSFVAEYEASVTGRRY